jgi:DNA-binding transcriptional MerR regulator
LEEKLYSISDLAAEFGISVRTLRFYEQKGLISASRQGSVRYFGRRERGRLKLILRGKRVGFSLDQIHDILALYEPGGDALRQTAFLLKASRQRLAQLEAERDAAEDAIQVLNADIARLEGEVADRQKPIAEAVPAELRAGA